MVIFFPTEAERAPFASSFPSRPGAGSLRTVSFFDTELKTWVSGVGKERFESFLDFFISKGLAENETMFVVMGSAGGIAEDLQVGNVLVSKDAQNHFRNQASGSQRLRLRFQSPKPIFTGGERDQLALRGYDLVTMEGQELVKINEANLPTSPAELHEVRWITDLANQVLTKSDFVERCANSFVSAKDLIFQHLKHILADSKKKQFEIKS